MVVSAVGSCNALESLWYLIGAMGDGTYYVTNDGHYVVEYGQKDRTWLETIESKALCLGYRVFIVHHKGTYWKAKIYSKEFYNLTVETLSRLHEILTSLQEELFKAYARGFFDAEGTITKHYRRTIRIRIAQKDRELLEMTAKRLRELGISATEPFLNDKHGVYVIQIPHHAVKKFMEVIGTEHPSKKARYLLLSQSLP